MLRSRNFAQVFSCLTALLCLVSSVADAKKAVRYKIGIDSRPSGAAVYVDGKRVGVSAPDFQVKLPRGSHSLRLDLGEDYKPFEESISVTGDADLTYKIEEKPTKVEIVATSTDPAAAPPLSAELFVNGQSKGQFTDSIQTLLTEGMYLIEVRKPGYRTYSEKISITKPNQKGLSIFAKLELEAKAPPPDQKQVEIKKDIATLQIVIPATDQSALGATLYVDGAPVLQGVRTGDSVTVQPGTGTHRVEAIKEGFQPFGQKITFAAGTTTTVEITMAKIPEVIKGPNPDQSTAKVGDLLVICDQAVAEVVVDGTKKYKCGEIVQKLTQGQHSLQASASGYETYTEVVDIKAGEQTVKRVSLKQLDVKKKSPSVRLVLNFLPGAGAIFNINGRKYSQNEVTGNEGVDVASGPVIIFVQEPGVGQFRTRFDMPDMPQRRDVVVELSNQGTMEIAADPAPVDVYVDKVKVGSTTQKDPIFTKELPMGKYVVEIRKPGGYQDSKQNIMIEAGKTLKVYASLTKPEVKIVKLDPVEARMGNYSFSAKTIDPGYWNLDLGGGYPYFADLRVNVGILRSQERMLGLDAGFEVRSFIYLTEIAAAARFQFVNKAPFSMGLNVLVGGGVGPDGRNNILGEVGLPLSLTLRVNNFDRLAFTVHPYVQFVSDDPRFLADDTAIPDAGRFTNVRFMLRAVVEIAINSRFNLWFMFEGEPTLRDREVFSNVYTKTMAAPDPHAYGRIGVTFKL